MRLADLQHDHDYCLRIATKLLGEQARALVLDSDMEVILLRQARLVGRQGLSSGPGVVCVSSDRKGHSLEIGVERYRCAGMTPPIDVLRFSAPHHLYATYTCYEFWAVADSNFRTLYRSLRKQVRRRQCQSPPLLRDGDLDKLWKNSIGFLRHGRHLLERFGVPQKRGILLLGEPGNGKTMACRWLRTECAAHRLHWRVVTAEQFEAARNDGEAHDLFDSSHPGIILFDDVDLGMREAGSEGHSAAQSTFLCGLDGLAARSGIVYLFTSNVSWSSIDPAFRRPGRIDIVMHFPRPDAVLRRRFVAEHWQPELLRRLDVDQVVWQSDGLSFADLDELKKLLVLTYLDTGEWNWTLAWAAFNQGRAEAGGRAPIGFQARCEPRSPLRIARA